MPVLPDAIKLIIAAATKYGTASAPKSSIPSIIVVSGVLAAEPKTHIKPIAAKNLVQD